MNLLIVEDDLHKCSEIEEVLEAIKIQNKTVCDNVRDAVLHIKGNTPDKIILDMSLPSHGVKAGAGSPLPMPMGGLELILDLRRMKKRAIEILILTQYPDIEIEDQYYHMEEAEEKIKEYYGMQKVIIAHYDKENQNWKKITKEFLEYEIITD
jgi:CheY-like chemotaxis protein